MVIDENSKQAGLPVLRKRITAKSMVEETLWEINVIPETTMVITPTSTGIVDPQELDVLRKGTSPIAFHKLTDEETQTFSRSFEQHRSVPEFESEMSQQEEEDSSDGYSIPRGGNNPDVTLYPGRFEDDKNASSQIDTSTPMIQNSANTSTATPGMPSNPL